MIERINMTIDDDMRDRFEAWRAKQYQETGRIPSLADSARILVHKGLVADGFSPRSPDAPSSSGSPTSDSSI